MPIVKIPYNHPFMTGNELSYIAEAHANRHLAGDGAFTKKCQAWLETKTATRRALLTSSCTAALEMAALLADVGPGDEVIMPSYTFSSTANAFVLRGAIPVFVDIREDTLNIDETLLRQAITPRTKAIAVVHYAGVACEMNAITAIAEEHGLLVIEDAAQGVMASYRGKALGAIGHLGAMSFHETKNLISGEGGALLVNADRFKERAEILWEKGTNRSQFFRGQIDKYTWVDVGSSFLPSELTAAFLWAQMEKATSITQRRLALWDRYHAAFAAPERDTLVRRPVIPPECSHNAHLYYLLLPTPEDRRSFLASMRRFDIDVIFHYVPLHSSPAGRRFGRASGSMTVTESVSDRLVRLPLWIGLDSQQEEVIDRATAILSRRA